MRRVWTALLASLLVVSTAVAGPNYAPGSLDPHFWLEWTVTNTARGPMIEGFVHNRSGLIADRMRLSIELLDAAGNVVGTTTTWVMGTVPADNRTWFQAHVPAAASYRVEILSFDWVGRGGGS
jgi:hypothetical protein